tara:strand:+ start:127 stop:720 length:594 start_codon:yes stop_codon:yes gene_type:complete
MILEQYAPKVIGFEDNSNHKKLEKKLINVCTKLKKEIKTGGNDWISKETYNTSNSDKFNIHTDKRFKPLFDWVLNSVVSYAENLNYETNFKCVDSWFNIYNKYDYQEYHSHSSTALSAVYFLKSNPEKSSRIFFRVDREPIPIDPIIKSRNNISCSTVWYKPIPGRLLIFRSDLSHCVERSNEDDSRISLAFNFSNK